MRALLFILSCCAVPAAIAQALPNPILFVTQTPGVRGESDIGTVTGTFTTHLPSLGAAPRGGSLHMLYPDGTVRDLLADALQEACDSARPTCDAEGVFRLQGGVLVNGYAVREPTLHWDGDRVVFSLLRNVARVQFQQLPAGTRWQLYEISGLAQGSRPVLTKVANQPADYNNVAPAYGSDDSIFFATDRPITGNPAHYPQIEEYESGPTVSGLWKLTPATGALQLLDHSPSGVFTPFVDSFGQVVYTRWDHFQQDQQALNSLFQVLGVPNDTSWNAFTYPGEADTDPARRVFMEDFMRTELTRNTPAGDAAAFAAAEPVVPEYFFQHPVLSGADRQGRVGQLAGTVGGREVRYVAATGKYGRVDGLRFNLFLPWQINQDGSGHETFRHAGRHEFTHFINRTYFDDPALADFAGSGDASPLNRRDGYFTITEAPVSAEVARGTYLGIGSPEFHTHVSGFILQMRDRGQAISENGLAPEFTKLTDPASTTRYRNPVMLSDGSLIAAVDEIPSDQKAGIANPLLKLRFRLYRLARNAQGFYQPAQLLTPAVGAKAFSWWDPDQLRAFSGQMWEMSPVEVRPRARPVAANFPGVPAPELQVFQEEGVDPAAFRNYLAANDLALIVSRDVTRRDAADTQQPLNLRVEPDNVPAGRTGAMTRRTGQPTARLYDVARLQLYQNDLLRGYGKYAGTQNGQYRDNGRRGLARPMHDAAAIAANLPSASTIPGAAKIAYDGSLAAFVPAGRAVTWTLSDKDDVPVVRERYWLKFAPGEVRVCASCHGINDRAQDGGTGATHPPEALRELLRHWRQQNSPALTVQAGGAGMGRVQSAPAGIDCGATCSASFLAGTRVTLTATPAAGALFAGWAGCDSVDGPQCIVDVRRAATVAVAFTLGASVPAAPVIGAAVAGPGQASVDFGAPPSDGGSPITGYTARCEPGAVTASGTQAPLAVAGLADGTAYTCRVAATNAVGSGPGSDAVAVTPSAAAPLTLVGAFSRKAHGAAGVFDLPLRVPGATPVTEPRAGAHVVAFRFNRPVTQAGIATARDHLNAPVAVGAVTVAGNEVLVGLPAADRARVTVTLDNVNGAGLSHQALVGLLLGDAGNARVVDALAAVRHRAARGVGADTFRFDFNLTGHVTAADVALARSRAGQALD